MDINEILGKLGFNYQVFLFNLINVSILLILLGKFIVGPVLKMIEERKELINKSFDTEKKSQLILEEANKEAKEIISKAMMEADIIVNNSVQEGNALSAQIVEKANERADSIMKVAQQEIEANKVNAIKSAKAQIADMVTLATKKFINHE